MNAHKTEAQITLHVNGVEHACNPDITVYQLLKNIGIEVPTFCYHPKLTVAGNCRMCLVDVKALPKPVASCAMQVRQDMDIWTDNEKVRTARTGVLELMLANHPLDCPICDQGGECDLQDIAVAYGGCGGRFQENKRAVPRKNFGPLIKGEMTRCIHCMRCVRFGREIAGMPELGGLYRGENTEISTVLAQSITTELSGNMIDICPVGALTAKPYAFQGRAWEFQHTPGIDIHDAVGSNIRIDTRGRQVMRVLPRANDMINEDWISDKARFAFDGLRQQRLDRCYVRRKGKLEAVTWTEAFKAIARQMNDVVPSDVAALAGDLVDVEALFALKQLMVGFGVEAIDFRQQHMFLPTQKRSDYLFATSIMGIEQADLCLIIGSNPRYEAPMVNARLRKVYLNNDLELAYIGPNVDLTYPTESLGEDLSVLADILSGAHPFSKKLKAAQRPMIILGEAVLALDQGEALYECARQISVKYPGTHDGWRGFNVLWRAASRVGALDVECYPKRGKSVVQKLEQKEIKVLYALGADEIDQALLKDVFVVYQGHHGDKTAQHADVILPGAAYPEKEGTYVNTEGRVQKSFQAVFPIGEAKSDWRIISDLADKLGVPLGFQSVQDVRLEMTALYPWFGVALETPQCEVPSSYKGAPLPKGVRVTLPVTNFYMTDAISRASVTMAQCVDAFEQVDQERTGTHG